MKEIKIIIETIGKRKSLTLHMGDDKGADMTEVITAEILCNAISILLTSYAKTQKGFLMANTKEDCETLRTMEEMGLNDEGPEEES